MAGDSGTTIHTLDKMNFVNVLMNHLILTSQEASREGWTREMEDMWDLLAIYLSPYCELKDWEEIDKIGYDLLPADKIKFDRAKRERINKKGRFLLKILHDKKVLFKEIEEEEFSFDPDEPWKGHRTGE